MLKMDGLYYTTRGNEIKKHINDKLLGEMDFLLDSSCLCGRKKRNGCDNSDGITNKTGFGKFLCNEMEFRKPKGMSYRKYADTFIALYSLLMAEDEWVPTLEMEFLLAEVIKSGIAAEEEASECYGTRYSPDLLKDIAECVITSVYYSTDDEEDLVEYSPDYVAGLIADTLYDYEHFSEGWFDICFVDSDYSFLDENTVEEIRGSVENTLLGIVPAAVNDEFYLPEDWLFSKDFRFLTGHKCGKLFPSEAG